MTETLLVLEEGIELGAVFALMAMGLALIYRTVRFLNFAHGTTFIISAYLTWYLISSVGLSYPLGVAVALCVAFLFGAAIELCILRPLRGKPEFELTAIIATIGLIFIGENSIRALAGSRVKMIPEMVTGNLLYGGISLPFQRILIIVVSVSVLLLVTLFLRKTKQGIAIRAIHQSTDVAGLLGINVGRMYLYTLGIGSILAGIAGIFLSALHTLSPGAGFEPLFMAFIVIVFGGIDSIEGTLYSAFLLGIVKSFAATYLGIGWGDVILFAFMTIMLIFRPSGLAGRRIE